MKKLSAVAASLLSLLAQQAHAFGVSPALVYSNLNWNFSSTVSGISSCNNMRLDGSGNLAVSTSLLAYGAINCPAIGIGYSVTGSAFIDVNGLFNMSLTFGPGNQLICARLSQVTLSGVCSVLNASGAQVGTAFIGYVP